MLWWLLACTSLRPGAEPQAPDTPIAEPSLPQPGANFSPALLALGEPPMDPAVLADSATCAGCHAGIAQQWSASAHAHASFDNPWYRGSIDAFREERSFEQSRFCGGCHDPVLVVSGRMDEEVHPEDSWARAGISCLSCHGASGATVDGNGSVTLSGVDLHLPVNHDAPTIALHTAAMRPKALEQPALCVSCHRGVLSPAMGNPFQLVGMDDGGPWRASEFGGSHAVVIDDPVPEQTCQGCHMPKESIDGSDRASHRFLGAQLPLAEQQDDPAQYAQTVEFLSSAAEISFAAARAPGGEFALPSALNPEGTVELDLVIRNTGTGHNFPGGLRDTQDLWLEVEVFDARGKRLAQAGTDYEEREDPSAFVLGVVVLDDEGRPSLDHVPGRFRTPAWDHTVPARESRAVRYVFEAGGAKLPLRAEATLRHRRHNRTLQALACEATQSDRGRAFNAAAAAGGSESFDACRPQPVVSIAHASAQIGPGATEAPGANERLRWHAFALGLDLQENLPDALDAVRLLREHSAGGRELAIADWLDARVLARQGRTAEALAALDNAARVLGELPALARVRAQALARVWRWQQAALAAADWARGTPGELAAWRELATARYSAGDPQGAMDAAISGLKLQPRDEGLLRIQALALRDRGHPRAAEAEEAWLAARAPDFAYALTERCEREVPGCADARRPIGRVVMRQPR